MSTRDASAVKNRAAATAPVEDPAAVRNSAPVEDPAGADSAPSADAAPVEDPAGEPERRRRGRPKGSTARTTRTIELMLTVSGTADGEWQAELKQGSAWLTRGLPVSAAAVSRAAAELHADLAQPIDAVIGAARDQRAARVAALEAELAEARKALAEFGDED